MVHRALPVDDLIQGKGIHLASACLCCSQRDGESTDHIFVVGAKARYVWGLMGKAFGINVDYNDAIPLLVNWFFHANLTIHFGLSVMILGNIILWGLWLDRNEARYNDIFLHPHKVINNILYWLKTHLGFSCCETQPTLSESALFKGLNVLINPVTPSVGKWIKWEPPNGGWCKLNTDGSFKDQNCAGGGVLRDCMGNVIMALAFRMKGKDNLFAEAYSLMTCLDI